MGKFSKTSQKKVLDYVDQKQTKNDLEDPKIKVIVEVPN